MNRIIDNRLFLSIGVYILLFIFCLPFYRYVFDVDAIGYIGAAKQYIAGNYQLAINGYWPPLHSWIILPFIKMGLLPEDAFKYSNGLIAMGSLYALHLLLHKIELTDRLKASILFTSIVIFLHFTFYELAADLLLVFLLLLLFNLVMQKGFYSSVYMNMIAGAIGALAFFAKSYAFPFFILYFILLHLCFNPNGIKKFYYIIAGLFVFFIISFPWIYLLHWKYGEWMIAHGKNNFGYWDIKVRDLSGPLLIAPPYKGSPAIWEDPWKIEKLNFKNIQLSALVLHQIRIILFNIQQWLKCIHDLSFLSSGILFVSCIFYIKEKSQFWLFLLISVFSLSVGYLVFHMETRFIWALTFLLLIAGSMLLSKLLSTLKVYNWQKEIVWLIFFGSFLLEPVNGLKDNLFVNRDIYKTAETVKNQSIQGSFTANKKQGESILIAYLSNNSYYTVIKPTFSTEELIADLDQHQIRYYFFYYESQQEKEGFLSGKVAAKARQIKELEPGLMVLSFY